jgi:ribose 5-phosphate isomerase B
MVKIGLAADHAGFALKEFIKNYLNKIGYSINDFGTFSSDSCDYADFAHPLAKAIENKDLDLGFSICGSGNGINMVVNKYSGIRSALCWNIEIAKLAVQHNNANICALPARFVSNEDALSIIDAFLSSKFEGGRHQKRIDKIPIN